jgi:hypothetical protein
MPHGSSRSIKLLRIWNSLLLVALAPIGLTLWATWYSEPTRAKSLLRSGRMGVFPEKKYFSRLQCRFLSATPDFLCVFSRTFAP